MCWWIFHDYGKWIDDGRIDIKEYIPEIGENLIKRSYLVQYRVCKDCDRKQFRRERV